MRRRLAGLLNAGYFVVLVLSAFFFYLTTAALLAGLLGAAYFLCAGFTVRGKAVEILVIVGFLTGLLLFEILRRPRFFTIGIRAEAARFPRLFAALDEVARNVGMRPVDEVILTPGAVIGVFERAGILGLLGRSHRVLELGIACLHAINRSEFNAILAHEYAHFTSRETLFRRFVARTQLNLQSALQQMRQGRAWRWSILYHALLAYEFLFRYFSSTFSRQREYYADGLASRFYGGNVLASGLVRYACTHVLFEGPAYGAMFRLLLEGRVMKNIYGAFRAYSRTLSAEERGNIRREILGDRSGLLDQHPCPLRRIARIRTVNPSDVGCEEDARTLFEDPEALEEELSALLAENLVGGLGVLNVLRPGRKADLGKG